MNRRRVWVTGVGALTAAGGTAGTLRSALERGRGFVQTDEGGLWAGRVRDFKATRESRRLDRSAQMFRATATEAWVDAGLDQETITPDRGCVIEGSSLGPMGEMISILRGGSSLRRRPSNMVRLMPGAGGAHFAAEVGLTGAVFHLSAGSASASQAIAEGYWKIVTEQADLVVVGGAECPIQPEVVDVFRSAGILSPSPSRPCRPFDEHRAGTVLGEGGAALILESAEHARRRDARPYVELSGVGAATESHSMLAPDPTGSGIRAAAEDAWKMAACPTLGWIKSHGTGTHQSDAAEYRGLHQVFGPTLVDTPIAGLKSMIGHCLGASGGIEAVATILALEAGLIPATIGHSNTDPEFRDCRILESPSATHATSALALSESFGGRVSALVFRGAA